jgi:hypothetical protein
MSRLIQLQAEPHPALPETTGRLPKVATCPQCAATHKGLIRMFGAISHCATVQSHPPLVSIATTDGSIWIVVGSSMLSLVMMSRHGWTPPVPARLLTSEPARPTL